MKLRLSSDPQAKQITADVDSIRKILKSCLVDGYGSFEGLGWTQVFVSNTAAVFKSKNDVVLIVEETLDTVSFRGCSNASTISDYTFSEKHLYKFFPTVYQRENGLTLNKSSLITNWTLLGTDSYFYFFSGNFLLFFGSFMETRTNESEMLICSSSFGTFTNTTDDHIVTKKSNNLFSPEFVGKITIFDKYRQGETFSYVNIYEDLFFALLGILPEVFVVDIQSPFNDGSFSTTFGKNILVKNFNGRPFFFQTDG
jgi:hypothetical protein